MTDTAAIKENIDHIEEAYEYMLAYAAQGRADEGAGKDGAHIRTFLGRFLAAAKGLNQQVPALTGGADTVGAGFQAEFARQSETIVSVLGILLARSNVSSEVVDNANALISMRAYLTDVFFIDKVLL